MGALVGPGFAWESGFGLVGVLVARNQSGAYVYWQEGIIRRHEFRELTYLDAL